MVLQISAKDKELEAARKTITINAPALSTAKQQPPQVQWTPAPPKTDTDSIIAELDKLEEHLTGDSSSLAKAAFQRVFESITLYWEKVSPRHRELVRAEIIPRFPFCLTVNALMRW